LDSKKGRFTHICLLTGSFIFSETFASMSRTHIQKNVSINLASINLGKLGGKDSDDVRNKIGNTQTRLSASERAEEVAAMMHGKDKDAKREEEVAALINYAKAGRNRLHESLMSFGSEASDGFSLADQALFINPLGAVDHIQSVSLSHGRRSPLNSPTLPQSPSIAPLGATSEKPGAFQPLVSREASQGSLPMLDSGSSPETSPTGHHQTRSVTFADSTDDDTPNTPAISSSSRRSTSSGINQRQLQQHPQHKEQQQQQQQQQQQGDIHQSLPQHANTSRGRLLKECAGLRNQVFVCPTPIIFETPDNFELAARGCVYHIRCSSCGQPQRGALPFSHRFITSTQLILRVFNT
jgi:hypothetical protein